MRKAALEGIQKQRFLKKVAFDAEHSDVRLRAVRRLEGSALLSRGRPLSQGPERERLARRGALVAGAVALACALVLLVDHTIFVARTPGDTERVVSLEEQTGTDAAASPGLLIDQPGSYVLTGDVTMLDANANCIEITADDVQIDLNGHTLAGQASGRSPRATLNLELDPLCNS